MRILVLSYETPAYPGAGGPSRQHCLLEPLAARHQIRVLSTGGVPPFGQTPQGVDIRFAEPGPEVGHPDRNWLVKNVGHFLSGPPWIFRDALHHCLALSVELPRTLEEFRPDVVQIEHAELGPMLDLLPKGLPTVLALIDMLLVVQFQQLRKGPLWGRAKAGLELPVVARQTRKDMRTATLTVTTTAADRRLAERLAPGATVRVVPNSINAEYFQRRGDRHSYPALIMTGSFHYQPNQAAARELIEVIFPAVLARFPEARLALVGQRMPEWLSRLAHHTAGVDALGQVADVRPDLWPAWVSVAPLREGSGSPLKVKESLAAGVPVVTTRRVTAALEVGPEDGVIAAQTSSDFADRICEILGDPKRRDELAARGQAAARRKFDRQPAALLQERVWVEARHSASEAPPV